MDRIIGFFMIMLLISLAACSSNSTTTIIYKAPEDAITAYLDGVAKNDTQKILQTCAINEMATNFKFDLYVQRLGGVLPVQALSPADYSFNSDINKLILSSQIFSQVKFLTYSLLSTEKFDGSLITNMDTERVSKFVKDIDPKRLANLTIKQISLPNKSLMSSSKYLDNAAQTAKVYGADESTERVVLFFVNNNYYYIGFTVLRYGESWKISSQTSPLSNANVLGTAQPTTLEEFNQMVNNN